MVDVLWENWQMADRKGGGNQWRQAPGTIVAIPSVGVMGTGCECTLVSVVITKICYSLVINRFYGVWMRSMFVLITWESTELCMKRRENYK